MRRKKKNRFNRTNCNHCGKWYQYSKGEGGIYEVEQHERSILCKFLCVECGRGYERIL